MKNGAKKLRLLIADDHELVRHGIKSILAAHRGWTIAGEARDGEEAVRMAEEIQPDVAILDVTMPKLDGLEAARIIAKKSPRTQILILTMHESVQMLRQALDAGAKGYVLKSELAADLVKSVRKAAEGKHSLTTKVSELVLQGFISGEGGRKSHEEPKAQPTPREVEIIRLMAEGKASKEIGTLLNIATRTVEAHRAQLMKKLDLHSTAEVVRYAIRQKIAEA
ncbi:MAG TPA: response regulator transcription factor [Candidatus Acidoferrum sp.]|nr:response regulator transcription factor [Candidatus Acidoferrum sp.]